MSRYYWTTKEIKLLREHYPHMETWRVAEMLGRPVRKVRRKATGLRLKKTAEYMASGISGRPGGKAVPTKYKPGNRPWSYQQVGSFRVNYFGYLQKKVSETGRSNIDWVQVHNLLWERRNGEIPEDYIVVFADGDKSNFAPENLLLISRPDHMLRNTIMRYPPELRHLMKLQGQLNRAIKEKQREESNV